MSEGTLNDVLAVERFWTFFEWLYGRSFDAPLVFCIEDLLGERKNDPAYVELFALVMRADRKRRTTIEHHSALKAELNVEISLVVWRETSLLDLIYLIAPDDPSYMMDLRLSPARKCELEGKLERERKPPPEIEQRDEDGKLAIPEPPDYGGYGIDVIKQMSLYADYYDRVARLHARNGDLDKSEEAFRMKHNLLTQMSSDNSLRNQYISKIFK